MGFRCAGLRTPAKTHRLLLGTTGEQGAEIVEFAFAAPLLLTLVLGIFWLGRALNTYQTMTRAAREGARYAAAPTCATCAASVQQWCTSVQTTMGQNQFPAAQFSPNSSDSSSVQGVVNCVLESDSLDPSLMRNFSVQQITLNPSDSPPNQEQGVSVSFSYPVSFPIPFVKISPITLTTQVQMRQEY